MSTQTDVLLYYKLVLVSLFNFNSNEFFVIGGFDRFKVVI